MAKLLILVFGFLTALCRLSHGFMKKEGQFTKLPSMDDKLCFANERVVGASTGSAGRCGTVCKQFPRCKSFFYDAVTAQCVGCAQAYNQSSPTLAAPGMVYYGPRPTHLPLTCNDLLASGNPSGVYDLLTPVSASPISVYCDMQTAGGGWLTWYTYAKQANSSGCPVGQFLPRTTYPPDTTLNVVWQNRYDNSVDFEFKTFAEYDNGFGSPDQVYWLGLKYLREYVVSGVNDVYLQFEDFDGIVAYEWFQGMQLSTYPNYTLTLGTIRSATDGSATSGMGLLYNAGQPFSTKDKIQNAYSHCMADYGGGWWFYSCNRVNVNGRYGTSTDSGYVFNYNLEWRSYSALKSTRLMIREYIP